MNGLRALEMAAGEWRQVFDTIYDQFELELLRDVPSLSQDASGRYLQRFRKTKVKVLSEFEIKLHCWDVPPLKLAISALFDAAAARHGMRHIAEEFDRSAFEEKMHDRLTGQS